MRRVAAAVSKATVRERLIRIVCVLKSGMPYPISAAEGALYDRHFSTVRVDLAEFYTVVSQWRPRRIVA